MDRLESDMFNTPVIVAEVCPLKILFLDVEIKSSLTEKTPFEKKTCL